MATSERMADGAPNESGRKVGHTAGRYSAIVKARNGDCTILDYYSDGEVYSDGPYSLAVARHLRPDAEVREDSNAVRVIHSRPTMDMMDRVRA